VAFQTGLGTAMSTTRMGQTPQFDIGYCGIWPNRGDHVAGWAHSPRAAVSQFHNATCEETIR